jgi:hypothetical protein
MRQNYFGAPIENLNAAFVLGFPLQQALANGLDHLLAIPDQIAVERRKLASAREHRPLDNQAPMTYAPRRETSGVLLYSVLNQLAGNGTWSIALSNGHNARPSLSPFPDAQSPGPIGRVVCA